MNVPVLTEYTDSTTNVSKTRRALERSAPERCLRSATANLRSALGAQLRIFELERTWSATPKLMERFPERGL